jgi:hypothetical protein
MMKITFSASPESLVRTTTGCRLSDPALPNSPAMSGMIFNFPCGGENVAVTVGVTLAHEARRRTDRASAQARAPDRLHT